MGVLNLAAYNIYYLILPLKVRSQVDPCQDHDCQNGSCVIEASFDRGYMCKCSNGYTGVNCEVDPCGNHDCQNGSCVIEASFDRGYMCKCSNGYTGENCEVDPCGNHDCQNGSCVIEASFVRGYMCKCSNGYTGVNCEVLLGDCEDILKKCPSLKGRDGVYRIFLAAEVKSVYCDMSTDGGGWTAIQRRQDNSTDFYKNWEDYKHGFGDPENNYWIGNDAIHELTKNEDQELRVELQSFDGDKAYAQYTTFYVGNEDSKFKLTVSGYLGTTGDSLGYHNGMMFSTKDQDNDRYGGDCAANWHGAWWYNGCLLSNLNGEYAQSAVTGGKYPVWFSWKEKNEALKQTVMMIRYKN
ncbi:fibrinogen-like protein A [Saccostrea echinata]|uniref:fibrinogen-like protein A n=1 Tax=Saccostrea echinata TaxID=191078 RepID=UPI002A813F38|nr:fibrinogen-like protein A [Saccostrea echinata]